MTTAPLDRQGHRYPSAHPDYPQPPVPWAPTTALTGARTIEAVLIASDVARGREHNPAGVAAFAAMSAVLDATYRARDAFRRAWDEAAA